MKGRLYDPLLRRFITPDPFVTDPLNPQGMNRYAYVQNNPLMFTDPSGLWGSENPNPSQAPNVQPIPPSVNIPTVSISEIGGIEAPPMHVPTAQGQGYMVPPSAPPPGGGADIGAARAEAANQAGQMQQMGQIAGYEGNARVANSSAGNSTFNAPPTFVTDKPAGMPSSDPGGYKLPGPDVPMDVPGGPRDSNHVGNPAVPIAVAVALCLANEECLAFAVATTFMASIGIVKAVESLVEAAPNLVDSLTDSVILSKKQDDPKARVGNPTKGDSPVWRDAQLFRSGLKRKGDEIWDWDNLHNDIEVYDKRGRHLGSRNPTSGEMYKPAVPGRKIVL